MNGHVPETASRRARTRFIRTPLGVVISLAVAALGFYLMFSHTGHILTALPYLFLTVCPLMHLFMHAGQHKPSI